MSVRPILVRGGRVVDPSQGSGRADLVSAACRGAVAMGADALAVQAHCEAPRGDEWCEEFEPALQAFQKLLIRPWIPARQSRYVTP